MEDIVSSPPSPNARKRPAPQDSPGKKPINLKGSQFMLRTPPDTDQSSNASADANLKNDDGDRAVSPAPSSSALSSNIEIAPSDPVNDAPSTSGPPAKKRKLTPSEKLEKQHAKEAKERERAEEKARRDEEKARKDEEKRVKDEEKRKKAEEREAKKREKELEEERKAQEKLKKERSQMRLGAFFQAKPETPNKSTGNDEVQSGARRRSLSLGLHDDVVDSIRRSASPAKGTPPPASTKTPVKLAPVISDYHRTFLPFVLGTHSTMPPQPDFDLDAAQDVFDREMKCPSLQEEQCDLGIIPSYEGHPVMDHYFTAQRNVSRGIPYPTVRELIEEIEGTLRDPIDLTTDGKAEGPIIRLRKIPVRHIQFEEDIRPPYSGTYTKIRSPSAVRRIRRNPFRQARRDTDYDGDSEAEWIEPEEGDEELLSEDEDDADDVADANDVDDLIDDEGETAIKNKRKMITGELIPQSTGLCWADQAGSIVESVEGGSKLAALESMRIGVLIPGFSGATIDPFSTDYWMDFASANERAAVPAGGLSVKDKPTTSTFMAPPRHPLQPKQGNNSLPQHDLIGAAEGQKGPITSKALPQATKRGPKPAPKMLSKEDLDEFKDAVVDSPLGKLELQKGLKARFPKMTNEVIKETLSLQFARVGKSKDEKKWVYVGGA